jgi:formylglycine-generating enzyme required for sulfatase activity
MKTTDAENQDMEKEESTRALRLIPGAILVGMLVGTSLSTTPPSSPGAGAETLRVDGLAFEFVRIPAGRFLMGSCAGDSDERPVHEVAIPHDFVMMATEVTVRQFEAFVESTGYRTDAERGNWAWLCPAANLAGPDRNLDWRRPGLSQSDDHPVVVVSRTDALAFCRWLSEQTGRSVRLPTEAEWEYAARAGGQHDSAAQPDKFAWYDTTAGGATHPVESKAPNPWGLYDMQGNAWEWCMDVWHPSYDGAPTDGRARTHDPGIPEVAWRYVLRGGCWARSARQVGPTYRYRGTSNFRNCGTGFRVVLDAGRPTADLMVPGRQPAAAGCGPSTGTRYRGGTTLAVGDVRFDFVRVPAGEFLMGSEEDGEEKPVHKVRIDYDFEMGRTEVTRRQFRAFIERTDYTTEAEKEGWGWTRSQWRDWYPEVDINWRNPGFAQKDDHPATCVSWYDAMSFCRWLSAETGQAIRLPSGSEWEYACRAGTTGDYAGQLNEMGWHRYNSGQRTHPVAQKKPNPWGLYDMHGNVWEWCRDMWHYGHEGAPTDGSAWVTADLFIPLMRGGSFTNPPWWLRSARNMRNDPGCRHSYNQGFRIVRVLQDVGRSVARTSPSAVDEPDVLTTTNVEMPKLVPVEVELPTPVFIGTRENIRAPCTKPVQTEPGPPFLAPKGTKNIALGKPVSSSDQEPVIGELEMVTDGDKEAVDGSYVELGPFLQDITIDLQAEHEIYGIRAWHYHKLPRVYFDVIVQISNDPDFISAVHTVFNNDMDNSAGLGLGTDMHYVDTCFGEIFDAKGAHGRYVRLYSNGSTANDLNHYVEVEVYGQAIAELPK